LRPPDNRDEILKLSPNISDPLFPPNLPEVYYTQYRPECYTDYRPHYNKELLLSNQTVGHNGWEVRIKSHTRPIPDVSFYESRPTIIATNGSDSGEIYFSVKISEVPKHVMFCAYMSILDLNLVDIGVELHVAASRLTDNYTPMAGAVTGAKRKLNMKDDVVPHHHLHHKRHREQFPAMHADYYSFNHTFHEDGRINWANITSFSGCLLLNFVPVGQHVVGIRPLSAKKPAYLTHMVIIR